MHFPAQPDQLVWLAKDLKDQALGIRVAEHLIGSYSSKWFQIAQSEKKVNAQLISIPTLSSDIFLAHWVKAWFLWEPAALVLPWYNESSNWLAM